LLHYISRSHLFIRLLFLCLSLFFLAFLFFFNAPPTTDIYTLSLHDALPIFRKLRIARITPEELKQKLDAGEDIMVVDLRSSVEFEGEGDTVVAGALRMNTDEIEARRSEEHTSELQSRSDLVCRLLLEKKKKK